MSTVILLCNLWRKKKKLQRVENKGGRTKLIKKEEEEENRKYVRGKNHILLERERAVVVVGLGARDKQEKTTRVINFKV